MNAPENAYIKGYRINGTGNWELRQQDRSEKVESEGTYYYFNINMTEDGGVFKFDIDGGDYGRSDNGVDNPPTISANTDTSQTNLLYKAEGDRNNPGAFRPGAGDYSISLLIPEDGQPEFVIIRGHNQFWKRNNQGGGNEGGNEGGGDDWSDITDWPNFRIRTGENSYAGNFVRTPGTNEYVCHTSSSAIGNSGQWFKICKDGDWNLNYGTINNETTPSTLPFEMKTQQGGMDNNFINQNWGKIVITFKYDPRNPVNNPPTVYFTKDEEGGDEPDPGTGPNWDSMNWPDFYIRDGQDSYPVQFTRKAGTNWYEVDIDAGTSFGNDWGFKVSDKTTDWDRNFGPKYDTPETVPFAVTTQWRGQGNDFKKKNWGDITIKFQYDPRTTYTEGGPGPIVYILPKGYTGELPEPEVKELSGTLPVLYINVYSDANKNGYNNTILSYNPIQELMSKDYSYFPNAYYWLDTQYIDTNDEFWKDAKALGSKENELPLEIKGRGNWTLRGFAKKPFKLKLGEKQNMLGMTPDKSKHYALIAHADDNMGYLKNFVGFKLGKYIGLPWTPDQRPVEVVINGNYRGLYFLTESIRVGDGRVEINEVDDNVSDMCQMTGGYVVEFDNYENEAVIKIHDGQAIDDDPKRFPIYVTPKTPEVYSQGQRDFVNDQIWKMHNSLGSHNNSAWAYLDLDDAVRYYLVEEIIGHYEAYHGSTYLFRDNGADQKWHFSPLWDCGHAFEGGTNNFFYDSPRSYGNTWIKAMKYNSKFNDKLSETWRWFMSQKYNKIYEEIDKYVSVISKAAKCDRQRWAGIKSDYTGTTEAPGVVEDNSDMESKKNAVKDFLNRKVDWLKGQWGDYSGSHGEPARDNTPAAALDSKYMEALPHTYAWGEVSKKPTVEYASESRHYIGSLRDKKDFISSFSIKKSGDLSLTKDEMWAESNWMDDYDNPTVEFDRNDGSIYLNARVPGVYNVKITMAHHIDNGKHYPEDTRKMTVTVMPSFREMQVSNGNVVSYDHANRTLTYTGSLSAEAASAMQFSLPFEGELYYTREAMKYNGVDLPLFSRRAVEETGYPHNLSQVTTDGHINMLNVAKVTMAHKVNGVVSEPYELTVSGGIPTAIEELIGDSESEARYFDLNGMEVSRPTTRGVYIRVCNGQAVKVLVK